MVDDEAVAKALQANAEGPGSHCRLHIDLRDWVHRTFHNKVFDKYTTTLVNRGGEPKRGHRMSLESVHNSIHDYTGGDNGNMAWNAVSAFDPIFWIHHV